MANPRTRLLAIIQILALNSDEFNILSADEIIEKLSEYGHDITKRCLIEDIKAINEFSNFIVHVNSPKKGYYSAGPYGNSIMQVLLKSIYSSPLVSSEETENIEDIGRACFCNNTWNMLIDSTANLNVRSTPKSAPDEEIFELCVAIKEKKQVMLTLVGIAPGERFAPPEKRVTVIVNPIKIGFTNNTSALSFTNSRTPSKPQYVRLSRILSVKLLDAPQNNKFKGKTNESTGFFDSAPTLANSDFQWLILRMKTEDAEYIDSVFELPFQYRKDEKDGYCIAKVNTVINSRLLGCLLRVKDKAEIIEPKALKKMF